MVPASTDFQIAHHVDCYNKGENVLSNFLTIQTKTVQNYGKKTENF